jgi:hypothetical protein
VTDKTDNDATASAVDDPPGGHNPAAFEDATKKVGAE